MFTALKLRPFIVAAALLTAVGSALAAQPTIYRNLPFEMSPVVRPSIPSRKVVLTDFGGVGDGVTLNTEAFSRAIAALSKKGGGTLVVPTGVWLTGPIELKSNINLNVTEQAIIIFSEDKSLYPIVPAIFEGRETYRCQSPISAVGQKNIAITGKGIIDGNGDGWRAVKRDKIAPSEWNALVRSGGIISSDKKTWYPSESFMRGAENADMNIPLWAKTAEDFAGIKDFLRPVMIYIAGCDRVLLEGVLFQNSPCWNIHTVLSREITVNDITVRCPWYAQNGDGIDIESCDRVVVTNSLFDAGDDAICIKSGKNEEGRQRGVPSSNIIVDNCRVFHGHGGFVVGSEMSGGVKNIAVTNCSFTGTDVGLRFKSTRGRGGVVENVYVNNIVMNDIATEALLFDLFYGGKSAVEAMEDETGVTTDAVAQPVDEGTPQFRNIYIGNVVCRGARRAMLFNGLPEMNVENIKVENSAIASEIGAQINESSGVELTNVKITPRSGAALMLNNVKNITVTNFSYPQTLSTAVTVTGSRNEAISLTGFALNVVDVANSASGKVAIK